MVNQVLGTLTTQSQDWQGQLANLKQELLKIGLPEAARYVDDVAQRAIGAVGTELRCNIDFTLDRLKSSLTALVRALLSNSQTVTATEPPTTCRVVPDGISLAHAPAKVDFFGYDYDRPGTQVVLQKVDGSQTDVTQFVDRTTHYHWSLNTSDNGVRIDRTCQRVIISFNGAVQGQVACLDDCPSLQPTVFPPESRAITHDSFTCGDSACGGCSKDWYVEKACDPGFQRVGGEPQAIREDSKPSVSSGWCRAQWLTDRPDDCSAKIHIGLSGCTTGGGIGAFYRCQLVATELKPARTIPPPPPPGWCGR